MTAAQHLAAHDARREARKGKPPTDLLRGHCAYHLGATIPAARPSNTQAPRTKA